jgi:hypothetical protein
MTFEVKVVEDSLAPNGKRLTTMQIRYPRFIHAEVLTHRDRARNASSSRAIPVKKMIAMTLEDPAFFVHIGKNQPGMQAREEVDADTRALFEKEWVELLNISAKYVERWSNEYGIHKQVANRALEPWQHISVVMSATEWANWDELRVHPDAQPEFQKLASMMKDARDASTPVLRRRDRMTASSWHLPYVMPDERALNMDKPFLLAKLSAARCARVSYLNHDGKEPNWSEDIALFDKLMGARPFHASPVEHQAYPAPSWLVSSGPFIGWNQHRKWLEVELSGKTISHA